MIAPALAAWGWISGTRLGRNVALYGSIVLAAAVLLWRVRAGGRAAAIREYEIKRQEAYADARKRMDESRSRGAGVDIDQRRDRLRQWGGGRQG